MLTSQLFSGNKRLVACSVSNPQHILTGDKGEHVALIQYALLVIEKAAITDAELDAGSYGKTTAAAVLQYKTKRSIINASYQTKPDNVVGIMTIKTLDAEIRLIERLQGRLDFGRPAAGKLTNWNN